MDSQQWTINRFFIDMNTCDVGCLISSDSNIVNRNNTTKAMIYGSSSESVDVEFKKQEWKIPNSGMLLLPHHIWAIFFVNELSCSKTVCFFSVFHKMSGDFNQSDFRGKTQSPPVCLVFRRQHDDSRGYLVYRHPLRSLIINFDSYEQTITLHMGY